VDKLERILTLTATLLEATRPLSAEELRDKIPGYPENKASFRRQFERDKDDLREMGIPLSVEEVPGTDPPLLGYRIRRDDYYLRDPGFTADELAAVHLATSLVRLDTARGIEGLLKLEGVADEPAGAVGGGGGADDALADLPGDPNLARAFSAVVERRPLTFTYRDRERVVDPHRIEYQRGRWYLQGREHDADGADDVDPTTTKSFRIDRIEGAVAVGEPRSFVPPPVVDAGRPAQPWEYGEGEPVVAHLLVDAGQAAWAVQHLGDDAVVDRRADGSVVVEVRVTNPDAFRSFVLTFLDHAEVLAPPALRDDVVAWLRELAG